MSKKNQQKTGSNKSRVGIKPLGDRVLVLPKQADDTKTKSGIILPDTIDKEKPHQGVVVAVGRGRTNEKGELIPLAVKVGDTVIFSRYSPDEIKMNDIEYYMISESSILGIIE